MNGWGVYAASSRGLGMFCEGGGVKTGGLLRGRWGVWRD